MMINGRYVHAEPGGFRRYATEVAARLDDALVVTPPLRFAHGVTGKIWEQTALAAKARDDVLWSPASSGPLRHRRHVVTLHDVAPFVDDASVGGRFGSAYRRLVPALARSAMAIVVDSEAMRVDMSERFDLPVSKFTVAPPGVGDVFRSVASLDRIDARRALGLGEMGMDLEAPLVGGLVSSIPRKNAEGVMEVMGAVVTSGAGSAVVAGWDGPARVFGTRSRPSAPAVPDLGSVTDEQLALFYRAVDVFVWLPSHEGFGLPVIEAAAAGTPVVCTPVPAACEHLRPDVAIVEGARAATVATLDLLADHPRRAHLGAAGPVHVADLTWDRTALGVSSAAGSIKEHHA